MEQDDSLERLQQTHRDLVALSESRLPNLDRLVAELEASIDDFRRLLDKDKKQDSSRQVLKSSMCWKFRIRSILTARRFPQD